MAATPNYMNTQLTAPATTAQPGPTFLAPEKRSALAVMGARFSVEPNKLLETLKCTAFKNATNEEMMALVIVANQYKLNPFTEEIYAFPSKGGGIVPVVSVDGWIRMMNDHPQFDGIEFEEKVDEKGKPICTTAIIYRKDRTRPVRVTEWYQECRRNTDPWNNQPCRMLRHRAICQGSRIAFGFSGIVDEDEAETIRPSGQVPKFVTVEPVVIPEKASKTAQVVESEPEPTEITRMEGDSEPQEASEPQKPPQTPPAAPKAPRGAAATAQSELEKCINEAGHNFGDFVKWADGVGVIADASSLTMFSEIKEADAKRLLRAKAGMLAGIAQAKGAA